MLEVNFGPEVDPERARHLVHQVDSIAENLPPERAKKARAYADLIVISFLDLTDDDTDKWLLTITRSITFMKPKDRDKVGRILPWMIRQLPHLKIGDNLLPIQGMINDCIRSANVRPMLQWEDHRILEFPKGFPTFAEAERERRQYADQIFEGFHCLQKILQHRGTKIRNWWSKKRLIDREKILTSAWPEINKKHRMDLRGPIYLEDIGDSENALKWPYLSLEDLTDKNLFLSFLHARALHPPSQFAYADRQSLAVGFQIGIKLSFLFHHTMMFTERDSPEEYGRVLPWSGNPQAKQWGKSRLGMPVHEGLVTMEVQAHVYRFLLECCLKITQTTLESIKALPDLPETDNAQGGPSQAGISHKSSTASDPRSTSFLQAPYRAPGKLDIDYIVQIVDAQRSSARDKIVSLREDPSHFADTVFVVKEHTNDQITGWHDDHDRSSIFKSDDFWCAVFGTVVNDAFVELQFWEDLYSNLQDLQNRLKSHDPRKGIEESLPKDLQRQFLRVLERISAGMTAYAHSTCFTIAASPPFRGFFRRINDQKLEIMPGITSMPGLSAVWSTVGFLEQNMGISMLPMLAHEIERVLEKETRLVQRLWPIIENRLSSISLLANCISQIECYQPWAASFATDVREQKVQLRNEFHESTVVFSQKVRDAILSESMIPLERPLHDLKYPIHKRRTKEITLQLQQSERELHAFWAHFDSLLVEALELAHPALREFYQAQPVPLRTPDWVEAPKPAPAPAPAPATAGSKRGFEEVEERTEATVERDVKRQKKEKKKTRGVPDPSRASTEEAQPEQEQEAPEETIYRVDNRTLQVFETMFYQPSTVSRPGSIPWKEFRHAMRFMGFGEEKLQGSAWHFTPPPSLQDKGSIHIHGPHPSDKHPFHVARAIGRRLRDKYGFEGPMFQPEE